MSLPPQEGHGGLDLVSNSKKDPQESKKSKIPTKTYIFNLKLGESNEETYPEFSWAELVRGAKTKERNSKIKSGTTLLDPYASDDEDDLKAMAARFEQKYSSKGTNKSKRCRVEEFLDRGAGYDDNDSFIDNTDVYDEVVPPGVQAFHGGFYINSGSLEFKDVVLSDDEDTQEKKVKPNRKSGFPTPPYPKPSSDQKASSADSNDSPVYSKSTVNTKPSAGSDNANLIVNEIHEQQADNSQNVPSKAQEISYQNQNLNEGESASKEKALSQPNISNTKPNLIPVKKVPRIVESSSSSSSSSSDDSSSSSDSDSSSSEDEDENQEDDNDKAKERIKVKSVAKEPVKSTTTFITEEKLPTLTPQPPTKMIPPLPALNPAPVPQKRLKTKNVPPNPNLAKNKPPLITNPNVIPSLNKGVSTKNKEIFLNSSTNRATSPNTNNGTISSLPRNQSPSGMNLSYSAASTPTSGTTVIKIPTPKSTPTPTSSPLGLGGPIYTSANSSNPQQIPKSSLPLNLLKPKPKPRIKKVPNPNPTPNTLITDEIFRNTLSGLNSIANASLLSQVAGSSTFSSGLSLNKPIPKARLNKITSSNPSSIMKGTSSSKKTQRHNSSQFSPKNLKVKSKHGLSPLSNTNPLSNPTSAAALLAFTNTAANQIASLTSLSPFRSSPMASAVEITKLRPAHLSSTPSASTNPNSYKSLSQHLGTGITVTEVGDKIRSTISSSPLSTATPVSSGSGNFVGSSNNNGLTTNTSVSNVNTMENSISSINNSLTMNRLLQSITITPTPLLNMTATGSSDRNSTSVPSVNNFTSTSRNFNSSNPTSIQKPVKHITPYDVSALLGKMDPSINNVTGNVNTSTANAMKASIEKIMLGNGLNPRDHQKK